MAPKNYAALTAKYHTSKIAGFEDLQELSTFGFRGEALSSLCAVADVSVVTRTAGQEAGVRLTYDHSGVLTGQAPAARAVGTTDAVRDLFKTLPVRCGGEACRAAAGACSQRGARPSVRPPPPRTPHPHRHKEFQRNLRREYTKLVGLLQAYALHAVGVRFIATNQVGGWKCAGRRRAAPAG